MSVMYFGKLLGPWRGRLVDVMEGLRSLESGVCGAGLQQPVCFGAHAMNRAKGTTK